MQMHLKRVLNDLKDVFYVLFLISVQQFEIANFSDGVQNFCIKVHNNINWSRNTNGKWNSNQ